MRTFITHKKQNNYPHGDSRNKTKANTCHSIELLQFKTWQMNLSCCQLIGLASRLIR